MSLDIIQQICPGMYYVASTPGHYPLYSFVTSPISGQTQTQHIGTRLHLSYIPNYQQDSPYI